MHMCIKYAHAYYAFVYTALGHAALVHACIVIQGAAEAAAGRGSPPPPSVGLGVWLLFGSGQGGKCLICSTFYSVLGQGLGSYPRILLVICA